LLGCSFVRLQQLLRTLLLQAPLQAVWPQALRLLLFVLRIELRLLGCPELRLRWLIAEG